MLGYRCGHLLLSIYSSTVYDHFPVAFDSITTVKFVINFSSIFYEMCTMEVTSVRSSDNKIG
jgi:hypothetical protein